MLKDGHLSCGEKKLALSNHEARILEALIAKKGEAVSREELSALIGESSANKVDVYICYLRNNKIQLNEYEITMITVKKDKSIKLRLTKLVEKWNHEINSNQIDYIDSTSSGYFSILEEAQNYYNCILKTSSGRNFS